MYEKTYNVIELSNELKVNQETIRRWIRNGHLKADRNSENGGVFIIKESYIIDFINKHPKYSIRGLEAYDLSKIMYDFKIDGVEQRILEIRENINKLSYELDSLAKIIKDLKNES